MLMRFLTIAFAIFSLGLHCACNRCIETCVNGVCKKKTCECDTWWEGDRCERSQLQHFEGKYKGTVLCSGVSEPIDFFLTVDPAIPNRLWLNSDELYFDFTTAVEFDILSQEWLGGVVTGEGQMLVNGISLHYTRVDTAAMPECLIEADLTGN